MKIILGTHAYTKRKKRINGTLSLQDDRHTGIIIKLYLFYCYITEIFFPHEEGKKAPFIKKIEKSFFKFHQYKKLTQI